MVSVYREVAGDRVEAVLPRHCPWGGDGTECRVGVQGHRERASGPGHVLVVARCHAHGQSFTLYPAGFTPYSRVPVVGAGADAVRDDGTVFGAVVDAALGTLWPVHSVRCRGCGQTQRRWLRQCAGWLGIAGGVAACEAAAARLAVPLAVALGGYGRFHASAFRRSRGPALDAVLRARAWHLDDLPALLATGGASGVVGRAWLTDARGVTTPVLPRCDKACVTRLARCPTSLSREAGPAQR